MANTSSKHRKKKITTWSIIILVVVIIGSFIISRSENTVDPASFSDVETFALEPRIKGNEEAELTLVEYSDFQCPFCGQAAMAIDELILNFGDQFSFEYRHFPLRSIHPNAQLAAQASEAAGVQGKFWEMHDILFERQAQWSESFNPKKLFSDYAEELELNVDRFRYDLESDEVKEKVNNDADQAEALGLRGTPSFILNGEQVALEEFLTYIDLSEFEESQETEVNVTNVVVE
jgi:protein-disulfide isomerase